MKRAALVETLSVLKKGIEKNKELPIFEHFCFTGDMVYASNLLFTITTPFKVKIPFAVNGHTFLDLLEATASEEVQLTVEGTSLVVKAGKSDFELPIMTPEQFIWKKPEIKGFTLDPIIAKSLDKVLVTCSENQALEGFRRICVKNEAGHVFLYSTDGDSMTSYNTLLVSNEHINFCLTRDYCDIVHTIAPTGFMLVGKEWVCVENDKFAVYGQNLGEPTLNYSEEINNLLGSDDAEMVPVPLPFRSALSRAIVVAHHETSATSVFVENGTMSLVTETSFGNVYDTIKTDHLDAEVQINAELLLSKMEDLQMMKLLNTCVVLKDDKMTRIIATVG